MTKYSFLPQAETGRLGEEDTRKYFSRFFLSVFTFELISFVLTYALVFVAAGIIKFTAPDLLENVDAIAVIENGIQFLAFYGIAAPLFLTVAAALPTVRPEKVKMGVGKWLVGLCICLLLMTAGGYISNILVTFIDMISGGTLVNPVETMLDQTSLWVDILFVVILAPILEELFFRKLLCDKLLALGEGVAVVVAGIIFGLAHGNFFQMPYALLVGFALSFIYVKTGKLIYTIGYHMALNFVGGVIAPWVVEKLDFEKIDAVLNGNPAVEEMVEVLADMMPLLFYEMVVMGLSTVGLVFLIMAIVKRQIRLESGIIPPAKERLFMNSVCTVGAAALVTIYVINFIISIIPIN